MAKDFWIEQLAKFSTIDDGVLVAKFSDESPDQCNILQILFKSREVLYLVTPIGLDNCRRFGISDAVTQAFITSDAIEWQEKTYKTHTPVSRTGSSIFDQEFRGYEIRTNFYPLNDIVSVKHRLLFESDYEIDFETKDEDEDEDDYHDWSPSNK